MVAPIFKFKSLKKTITTLTNTVSLGTYGTATPIYGVETFVNNSGYSQLDIGVLPTDVSSILLTVQCSNTTGLTNTTTARPVAISAFISNSISNTTQVLVWKYPVIPNNAFDPLNGNLVMTAGDVLLIQSDSATGDVDVVVSLLEIANTTAN